MKNSGKKETKRKGGAVQMPLGSAALLGMGANPEMGLKAAALSEAASKSGLKGDSILSALRKEKVLGIMNSHNDMVKIMQEGNQKSTANLLKEVNNEMEEENKQEKLPPKNVVIPDVVIDGSFTKPFETLGRGCIIS